MLTLLLLLNFSKKVKRVEEEVATVVEVEEEDMEEGAVDMAVVVD